MPKMKSKNLYSQYKLLKHLDRLSAWDRGEIVYPVLVGFNLTNSCNNRCPLCTSRRKDNTTVGFEDAKDIIQQLKEVDVKAIALGGGGDPSCHGNFEEIIRFIKDRGMEVGVCTNGYKLSDGVIDAIASCCLWMSISLDADCPEIYKKIHGMDEQAFNEVVNNMNKIVKKRREIGSELAIRATYLIGPETITGIYNAAKLCKDIGIDGIRFRPFFVWEKEKDIKLDGELMFKEFEKCKELENDNFSVSYPKDRVESIVGERKRTYKTCNVHHFHTVITPDLKMYPCCMLEDNEKYCLGDLKEKSFREIWKSETRKEVYQQINLKDCPNPCMLEKHNEILNVIKGGIAHSNFL
jgi:MoaA/NifB/PqqE/SkfB family radical SAM enzyme